MVKISRGFSVIEGSRFKTNEKNAAIVERNQLCKLTFALALQELEKAMNATIINTFKTKIIL